MPTLAKPEFSELSFAFALTHEFAQRHRWRLASALYFPTLEEESILGWDAGIEFWGLSFFIQFKRAELFQYRKQAPCYRFPIYKPRKSAQHNLLIQWSQRERLTFYCAPCFTTRDELTSCALDGRMTRSSKFVPARTLPRLAPTDNAQHYITFTESDTAQFRSKPVDVEGVRSANYYLGGDSSRLMNADSGASLIDSRYFQRLNQALDEIGGDSNQSADRSGNTFDRDPVGTLRARLRSILEVEWFLMIEAPPRDAL